MLLIAIGLILCCCLLQAGTVLLIPPGVDTVLFTPGLALCC